jgi:hypothetical protein
MKKKQTGIIASIILILIIIQFFPVDKSVPETDPSLDFFVITNPRRKITAMIKTSCYDCHSYKTEYPWYSNLAPLSWLLRSHIKEGREHLNLSEFGKFSREQRFIILASMKKEISEKEMPLKSYTFIHKEAMLTADMREALINWLSTGRNDIEAP